MNQQPDGQQQILGRAVLTFDGAGDELESFLPDFVHRRRDHGQFGLGEFGHDSPIEGCQGNVAGNPDALIVEELQVIRQAPVLR